MRLAPSLLSIHGGARPIVATTSRARQLVAGSQAVRWASSKRGGSSSRYMQRQKTDVYVKQRTRPISPAKASSSSPDYGEDDDFGASSGGFVARSAFKLLQLDDRYKFLRPGRVIVDLGAAPGGWSQAIVERTRTRSGGKAKEGDPKVPVFALDLLPVVAVDGVTSIQGDFLDIATQERLRKMVADAALSSSGSDGGGAEENGGFVDVVVSDMMGEPIS